MRAGISTEIADPAELLRRVLASPPMVGSDLALAVSPRDARVAPGGRGSERFRVAAVDYGMKRNIVRLLQAGSLPRDGLSGDGAGRRDPREPARRRSSSPTARAIRRRCRARSARSRGSSRREADLRDLPRPPASRPRARGEDLQAEVRPPRRQPPGAGPRHGHVAITSQNHGFAVDAATLPPEIEATHRNLNDGTLEGFRHRTLPILAAQFHPEAAPGPHDANVLFQTLHRSDGAGAHGR